MRRRVPVYSPAIPPAAHLPVDGDPQMAAGVRQHRVPHWLGGVAAVARHPASVWGGMALLACVLFWQVWQGGLGGEVPSQKAIDAAVLRTLENEVLPSPAALAYAAVIPSVVRVTGFGKDEKTGEPSELGVGTGVVIVDRGVILTNLHVVQGVGKVQVEFMDGLVSPAWVIGVQPENDLAVLQAAQVPDDLLAATLASTADLEPGVQVAAVGFPFGIGPSVSAGVVSGLRREFRSPEGKQLMTNLIQFDAAANPGNSGGPLVNMAGEVVGIVTAIFNPSEQRTFVGIGFAVPIENAASAVGLPPF